MKNAKVVFAGLALTLSLSFATVSQAASQCVGLSNSACGAKSSCTWRKSSVDKNGKKTKAHCRALPNKSKKTSSNTSKKIKKSSSVKKKTSTSSTKKKTAAKSSAKKAVSKKKPNK